MKDILITLAPRSGNALEVCETIAKGLAALEIPVQRPIETTFLLSGPKSFQGATWCHRTASDNKLPIAIFEVESTLLVPEQE